MRTKLLKQIFLAVALLGLGTSNAWGNPVYFGSSTKDKGPWADGVLVSPDYTVVKGSTTTVYYTNETNVDEALTWQAFWNGVFEFNCGAYWVTTRADNLSGETWQHADIKPTVTYSDNFAEMFTRDNMNGASVVLKVTRDNDNSVEVLSTTTKGDNTWWKKVTFTLPIDDNMVFRLRAENCYGTITSVIGDKFIGPASNSTTWWNNFSEYYTIEADKTLTLNFKNYTNKSENWNNFVAVIANDYDRGTTSYSEQVVLRVDNYGWGSKYNGDNFSNNYNWTTLKNDLDGADVELKIRRSGTKVAVKATYTTTAGDVYYQQYVFTSDSGTDTYRAFLTVDNSHISDLTSSVTDTPADAAEYLYTIKAVDGSDNDLKTFTTGAYWTGETAVSVTYPMYILSGTTLYNIAANGSTPYYSKSFTPNSANFVGKLCYDNGTISNVVFYTEAEDVSGASAIENIACSNGRFARWGSTEQTVTSLKEGTYKVFGKFYSGNPSTSNVIVKAGDSEKWKASVATGTANSEDFTLAENTEIKVSCEGASTRGLDWIYIQQTGVTKSISAAGWATYCSPYALDFSSPIANLEAAYIVKGGKGTVLTTEKVTGTVAANTGLLLKGSEGTVSIPVVASGTDYSATNKLVGVTAEYNLDAGTGYVLLDGDNDIGFYKNPTAAFTVGANTAYLPVGFDGGSAPAFYSLFDSETTGIGAALVNSERVNNEVFNLQGQRVSQPTKGLYIVNGKKIIVK